MRSDREDEPHFGFVLEFVHRHGQVVQSEWKPFVGFDWQRSLDGEKHTAPHSHMIVVHGDGPGRDWNVVLHVLLNILEGRHVREVA